ncbi:MAG: flippase-like domain-containing protein [Clostridia bacterium]|nr:flippase-like domain-containing protein [Clostridia bacterium]
MENRESTSLDTSTVKEKKKFNAKKILWPLLFLVIAVLTCWAVTAQNKSFSFKSFLQFLGELDIKFVILAFVATFGFIFFEGVAIKTVADSFGHKRSLIKSYSYSAADIYFSAITPSASGGQPASAFFMIGDGIPGSAVTVILLVNIVMYTFAILIIGALCFIIRPMQFLRFSAFSKALIIVGIICQLAIATFFILLLVYSKILYWLGNTVLTLLHKIRIVKKLDERKEKLKNAIDTYAGYVAQIKDKKLMLVKTLIFNVLQRSSLIAVTAFAFLAYYGDPASVVDICVNQGMVILGSNTVPIPGAMGVIDYLLLDSFGEMMPEAVAVNLELLSRAISFYFCVIVCGATFFLRCFLLQFKKRKRVK